MDEAQAISAPTGKASAKCLTGVENRSRVRGRSLLPVLTTSTCAGSLRKSPVAKLRLVLLLLLTAVIQARGADPPARPTPAPRPTPSPTSAGPGPRRSLPPSVSATVPLQPPLPPEEAVRTLKVAEGFRVELVAAEPLVETPVSMSFDPDGRLWVVEMPGFMPNVEGQGEKEPTGRVVILDDTDGDGRVDQRKVFLDGLVLPRSVSFTAGGVLIAAPPELIFCADKDRDDRCDAREVISTRYGTGENPEHDANGLVFAMDNWLYSANIGWRHRFVNGAWAVEPTISRGQWGISQDDYGRLVYNTNGVYLRADFLPVYMPDAHVRGTPGVNVEIDPDQSTWPARPNTGVNRAYNEGTLRADGTLAEFTAACGPTVYRGDQFPPAFQGNAFVAEPAGNFVRRSVILEYEGKLLARNAHDSSEFLTSTDERFRPVNLTTGPDGALYVADMYRGLIQHRIYLTPFLRGQIRERALDRPVDRGRIWRVAAEGRPLGPRPRLSQATPEVWLSHLAHPNGWWRDTAQRLLVESGAARELAARLTELAASAPDPRTRLHAFFALDGIGLVDRAVRDRAAQDGNRFVKLAAASFVDRERIAALTDLAVELAREPKLDAARLERAGGRELTLLARMLSHPEWTTPGPGRAELLRQMASRLIAEPQDDRRIALLELITGEGAGSEWRQVALLEGVAAGKTGERAAPEGVVPRGWSRLLRSPDADVRRLAGSLELWATGRVREPRPAERPGLNAAARARFARGQTQYAALCGVCHHVSGIGEKGKAPPLTDSSWVTGSPERLVRITLHGLRGPVKVAGRSYNMEMPAMGALTDEQIADILTYIRNERDWGHEAGPIEAEAVARIRRVARDRKKPWTAEELLRLR